MLKKIIVSLFCFLFFIISINAQSKSLINKIKLGEKIITVKGTIFNEIIYTTSTNQTKYVAYQFWDKVKKTLIISEIEYEIENGKFSPVTIETYICPLAKIDKQTSYNIEMEDKAVSGGKYWRLTLLSLGQGVDNLHFQSQNRSIFNHKLETKRVNNVTINILKKAEAEKWLKTFTR